MANRRAIAVQGIGYGRRQIAVRGFRPIPVGDAPGTGILTLAGVDRRITLTRLLVSVALLERTVLTLDAPSSLDTAAEQTAQTLKPDQHTVTLEPSETTLSLTTRRFTLDVDDD